jgi:hypothetical protein
MSPKDDNISFSIDDSSESDQVMSYDISDFLHDNDTQQDLSLSMSLDYQVNFGLKQLLQICDYYGITKMAKCNKEFVINTIVNFELNDENADIVTRRRTLWFYISELRNDKFMKKYIFW